MDMYQKRKMRKEKRENSNQDEKFHKVVLNWYPGHMAKTKRLISEKYELVDIVYELIDARIPYSSKIKNIDSLIKNKPRILIMTKSDLCDVVETNKWVNYYEEKGYKVVLADLTNNNDFNKIISLTREISLELNEKRKQKGLNEKEIKVLVIGIPNVGKSTLINKIVGRKVANTGNIPGITKNLVWLKTKYNILLLDTPGILWPKLDSEEVALNLASMTAIKGDILPTDKVAVHILNKLNRYYPNILKERYKIDSLTDDLENDYNIIGRNLNLIKRGNEVDFDKLSLMIVNDLKNYLKGITFDRKEDFND